MSVDRQADGAVLADRLVRDRGRRPDCALDRRVIAPADLGGALEVEDDPGVGGLLELELLDLDLAVARGRLPVDPVERVAGRPGPDRGRERRGLERPLGCRVTALDVRRRKPPERQRLDPRVDDRGDPGADRGRRFEEAERVAQSGSGAARSGTARGASTACARARIARSDRRGPGARPGRPAGNDVGLWISSHGFGMRLVFRIVYVTRSRSPT